MSRKLIFAAGLLLCFGADLELGHGGTSEAPDLESDAEKRVLNYLLEASGRPPLEALARAVLQYGATPAAQDLFGAYDEFLAILGNAGKRSTLASLDKAAAMNHDLFAECKNLGTRFQSGLTQLFFKSNPQLTHITQHYGVF